MTNLLQGASQVLVITANSMLDFIPPKLDVGIALPQTMTSSFITSSGSTSPALETEAHTEATTGQKKKKKKKSKKSNKVVVQDVPTHQEEPRLPVLCISRNKHWRYISSYHVRFHLRELFSFRRACSLY
jgi:hypothetical protein